jgi:hypothetical protein
MNFGRGSATSMTIDASGNVGIGTSSVTSYFGTTARIYNAGNGGTLQVAGSSVTGAFWASEVLGLTSVEATTNHPLMFATNATERMRISSTGNVGIGTSSPNEALNIYRGSGVSAYVDFAGGGRTQGSTSFTLGQGSDGVATLFNRENAAMYFATNSTERMRILSGGNVGIGTASPRGKVEIVGPATETSTLANAVTNAGLLIQPYNASSWGLAFGSLTGQVQSIQGVDLSGSGSRDIALNALGGNVGIGTSSPGNKLAVAGGQINTVADEAYGIALNATTGNMRAIPYAAAYAGGALVSYAAGYAGYGTFTVDALNIRLWTAGTERMRITSAGNLLVATTSSPAYGGIVRIQGGLELHNYPQLNIAPANANPFEIVNRASGGFDLYPTPSVLAMRINSSGDVGIGTATTIGFKTRISGGNNNTLLIDNDGSQYTGLWFANNGTTKAVIGYNNDASDFSVLNTTASGNLLLGTVGAERMRINSSGNVGIGVVPSAWTIGKAFQLGGTGSILNDGAGTTYYGNNFHYDGAFKYTATGSAGAYVQVNNGQHW